MQPWTSPGVTLLLLLLLLGRSSTDTNLSPPCLGPAALPLLPLAYCGCALGVLWVWREWVQDDPQEVGHKRVEAAGEVLTQTLGLLLGRARGAMAGVLRRHLREPLQGARDPLVQDVGGFD